jgi:pimeloyl-ACP methyl ester carboxylesterase
VLLVHGVGPAGARDWRETVGWLQQSYHVVALDLPGFGASSKANAPYTPANYAAVLKHVVERFIGRRFVLVGHSMGAVVSLRYAASHAQDVERLVLIDAPGILHRYAVASDFLAQLGLGFVRGLLVPLERLRFEPREILASAEQRASWLGGDPARIAGLAAVSDDLSGELGAVRVETLVLWGGQDLLAPVRTGKVLAARLPRARLQIIEEAGHTPMLEAPAAFRAALAPFLERGLLGVPEARRPPPLRQGSAHCRGERDRVYEGDFDVLTLEGCSQITIRRARVRELRIVDSIVAIEDSRIGGGETGLHASGSTVVATSVRFEGTVAITAQASRLDLADVELEGSRAAIVAPARSHVVFSFSRVVSPNVQGDLHDFFTFGPENPL